MKRVAFHLIALAVFYTTCYVAARLGHHVIHLENRVHQGSRVIAEPEEWIDITKRMARDSGLFLLRSDAIYNDIKPSFLNRVFLPHRKLEEAHWNSRPNKLNTNGEQDAGGNRRSRR